MADTIPKCHLANEQGEPCQFFRWAPGSSKSPSASPPTLATPTLPSIPVAATYTSAPAPVTTTSSGLNPSKCPIQGCGQTRLADDCTCRFCRKHCLDAGGCSSKTHRKVGQASLPLPSNPSTTTLLPIAERYGPQTQPPSTAIVANDISSQPLDARPDPHFASHLLPIYVESLAREQALELSKSKLDAERIASTKQAVQKVTVHAWRPDNAEPESCQLQKGFTWPFLKLSSAALSLVGLQASVESGTLQMYDESEGYWLTVGVDHIIEVHEGQHVFLRDRSVRKCERFDEHFNQVSRPHLRNNLPQERAYVCNAWRSLIPANGSSSPQKRKAASPPNVLPHAVKRERSCSTLPESISPLSPSLPSASSSFLSVLYPPRVIPCGIHGRGDGLQKFQMDSMEWWMDSMGFPHGFHGFFTWIPYFFHMDSILFQMDSMDFPDGFHME